MVALADSTGNRFPQGSIGFPACWVVLCGHPLPFAFLKTEASIRLAGSGKGRASPGLEVVIAFFRSKIASYAAVRKFEQLGDA